MNDTGDDAGSVRSTSGIGAPEGSRRSSFSDDSSSEASTAIASELDDIVSSTGPKKAARTGYRSVKLNDLCKILDEINNQIFFHWLNYQLRSILKKHFLKNMHTLGKKLILFRFK